MPFTVIDTVIDALDGPLYYLNGARRADKAINVIDLALLSSPEGKVALVFSDEAGARAHLSLLPEGVTTACASDLRDKEELFRAALERGADTLWLDAPVGRAPRASYPLRRALEYILSYKRQSACL